MGDAFTIGFLFFLGFLALSGAGLSILRYWLVEGTLDGALALALLGGTLTIAVIAIKSASPGFILLGIGIIIGATVGLPALAARGERSALMRMHEEDIGKYRRALEVNPHNTAAWREIGEIYMRMDRYDEAITAYKEAIRRDPSDVQKIRRRLNQALEYRAGLPNVATLVCDACGKETPKGKVCLQCGAALELNFLDWLLERETLLDILRPTVAIAAGAIATLALFSALSLALKIIVVVSAVLVGAYFTWRILQNI